MGLRVVELFAGMGGFRLGLQAAGHEVVWSNQWEPGKRVQHASDCYVRRFGPDAHSNEDISKVPIREIPQHDLLVGGFPCQDYSVAATLDKSGGIQGKKGVLWWEINRIVKARRPQYILLENVDRLLRSPATQRGRDFAIVLRCLGKLGYHVEWRVLNAADYGFPQRRRRTFIFAARKDTDWAGHMEENAAKTSYLTRSGFFGSEFPALEDQVTLDDETSPSGALPNGLKDLSDNYEFHFMNAGVLLNRRFWTRKVVPKAEPLVPLSFVLERDVPEEFYIPEDKLARWEYLKGAKNEWRTAKNGHRYRYTEGGVAFPDPLNGPSRTLLTGEGGLSPSRSNHAVEDLDTGRIRVLTPVECERLNGFPDDWTEGMPRNWRYFTMGNALVVGLVQRMMSNLHGHRKALDKGDVRARPHVLEDLV